MKDSSSKKASAIFETPGHGLKALFLKVKELQDLTEAISHHLEPDILRYAHVANLMGNKLVLLVANGSIATQIRFQTIELLRKFKQDPKLKIVHQIECKVRPVPSSQPGSQRKNPLTKMQALSPHTAELVNDIAETLEDPTLREALKKIARHVKAK